MPIDIQQQYCPTCGGCCVSGCINEVKCLYECCGCCTLEVCFGANQKLYAGQILAEKQTDQLMYAYDPTNDELDKPAGILRYYVDVDDDGKISNFKSPIFGAACNRCTSNMYYCGTFRTQDIHGNLAAAIQSPGFGRIVLGTPYSNGIFKLS